MKWFGIVLTVFLALLLLLYTLLFTPFGNGVLKPVIESRLNASLGTEAVVETFVLDMSSFEIDVAVTAPEARLSRARSSAAARQEAWHRRRR